VVCQERLAQRQSGEHCTFARKANRTGLRRYRCDCSTPLPSATYNQPFVNDYEKPLIHTEVEHLGEAGFTDISRDRQSGTYAADYIIAGHRGIAGRPRRGAGDASPGGKRRRADLDRPFSTMRRPP
jgi:hypothetical protein